MKINTLAIAGSLLFVAGCSHQEKHVASRDSVSAPAYGTTTPKNRTYESSTPTTTESSVSITPSPAPGIQQSPSDTSSTTSQQLQPSNSSDDTVVITQVREALTHDSTVAPVVPAIQIRAEKGTVTLTGNVSSEQQKQAIEHLVKGTSGVVTVNNQLQVSVAPTSGRADQSGRIYSNATSEASVALDPFATTQSSDSRLSATGKANNRIYSTSQDKAPGSLSAEDLSLNAQSSQQKSDSTSAGATEDKGLSPTSQRPNSSSRIYSTNQTEAATSNPSRAASSADVFDVNVQGATETDKKVGHQIIQELRADTALVAIVPSLKISIENGKAVLSGTVKSEDEKSKIESTVKRVTGVTSVEDQLLVGANAGQIDSRDNK
jgi:osmotically-inducible protein OsmY